MDRSVRVSSPKEDRASEPSMALIAAFSGEWSSVTSLITCTRCPNASTCARSPGFSPETANPADRKIQQGPRDERQLLNLVLHRGLQGVPNGGFGGFELLNGQRLRGQRKAAPLRAIGSLNIRRDDRGKD